MMLTAPSADAQSTSAILVPEDGMPLCPGEKIIWTNGDSPGEYRLRIGTTPNGKDLLSAIILGGPEAGAPIISAFAPALADGDPVYVSLRYRDDDGSPWVFQDSAVFDPCESAVILANPQADLCIGDALEWSDVADGKFRLRIGTTPDGDDVMSVSTTSTRVVAEDLPNDAGALYGSLRFKPTGGSWVLLDQVTFIPCLQPIKFITSGDLCTGDDVAWMRGYFDDAGFQLRLGTTPNGNDVLSKQTTTGSITAPILPPGETIYATLRANLDRWRVVDTAEFTPCSNPIVLTGPAPGQLCSSDVLTWTGEADRFRVQIFDDNGQVMNESTRHNEQVAQYLAADESVSVLLLSKTDGVWTLQDQATYSSCPYNITLVSDGGWDDLCANDQISTTGPTDGNSRLWFGTTPGGKDLLNMSIPAGDSFVMPVLESNPVTLYTSVLHKPTDGLWAIHHAASWPACGINS